MGRGPALASQLCSSISSTAVARSSPSASAAASRDTASRCCSTSWSRRRLSRLNVAAGSMPRIRLENSVLPARRDVPTQQNHLLY